jgi:hypothetical protein
MSGLSGEGIELEIVFKAQSTRAQMDFSVGEFVLSYNFGQGGKIGAGGQWRSLQPMADGNVHIRAFYDRGIWEVFANGGEFYYPAVLTPKAGTWPLSLVTRNASIDIVSLSLHKLGTIGIDGFAGNGTVTNESIKLAVTNEPANLADDEVSNKFGAYPNPSSEAFIIRAPESFTYHIFDQLGNTKESGAGENGMSVGSQLAPGPYILRISAGRHIKTLKVIKK